MTGSLRSGRQTMRPRFRPRSNSSGSSITWMCRRCAFRNGDPRTFSPQASMGKAVDTGRESERMVTGFAVGQRVKRQDSPQKLTGLERFTGDLKIPGLLYARPVGSAYAHARIRGVDKSAALAIPGVIHVFTADDLPIARDANGNPVKIPIAFGEALYAGHVVA